MRLWLLIGLAAGLILTAALIIYNGADLVGTNLLAAGWGVPLVIAARIIVIAGAGVAWREVTLRKAGLSHLIFIVLRIIRESINSLLPVAQVGGDILGARLLTFFGLSGAVAAASIVVDIFLQTVTQLIFTLVGFVILVAWVRTSPLVHWIGYGLIFAACLVAGFFVVQRAGTFRGIGKLLARLVNERQWRSLAKIGDLDDRLRETYRDHAAVARSLTIHLTVWFFGSCEVWLALWFMGHPVSIAQAISIEALGQAVRGAAFVVPGAYGIQEGGYVALCAAFGVPPQTALALSLVKRVPDFAMGVPGLIVWQAMEGQRLWKTSGRRAS